MIRIVFFIDKVYHGEKISGKKKPANDWRVLDHILGNVRALRADRSRT
jgi:hypothetical protein